MTAFGLGPMPGTSMAEACDIVLGETGDLPHLPQLPERGLGSDAVGRTAGLLRWLTVDRGPRAWRLVDRPQLASRHLWDLMERDLDTAQEVWGESLETVKVQVVGPWTLAAQLELPNGHRALTDRGATRDLADALEEAVVAHRADVARRFGGEVVLQVDEPALADATGGKLRGTTDFERIRAVPEEVALDRLQRLYADILNAGNQWEFAPAAPTLAVTFSAIDTARDMDGVGQLLENGGRLALGVETAASESATATDIVEYVRRVGHDVALVQSRIDVYPLRPDAAGYRHAAQVAEFLARG